MRRVVLFVVAVLVSMAPIANAGASPGGGQAEDPGWFVDESKLPFEPLPGFEDATLLWGVLRGAGYPIEVPADWNGSLVMWAYGYPKAYDAAMPICGVVGDFELFDYFRTSTWRRNSSAWASRTSRSRIRRTT